LRLCGKKNSDEGFKKVNFATLCLCGKKNSQEGFEKINKLCVFAPFRQKK
jgi:hypothetical protein